MKVLTALSLVILFAGCKSKESVLLKLKCDKDDQSDYTISVKADCSAQVRFNTSIDFTYSVDSVSQDSEYFMDSKITSIKTDINIPVFPGPDYNEEFDSDKSYADMNDEEQQVYAKYDSIMSKNYQVGYSSNGEVVKTFTMYGKTIDAPFSISVVQLPFPMHNVKVGDTWTADIQDPLANSSTKLSTKECTFTYTVDDITPTQVIVDVSVVMSDNSKPDFKGTGVYKVNRKNGHVEDAYIKVPLNGCDDALISVVTNTNPSSNN